MLINEAGKMTGLTKKAIEYYTEQELVSPSILENGYRDFSQRDIEDLKKIAVYRKLGLSAEEIKAVLADHKGDTLQKLAVQKELTLHRQQVQKRLLERLASGEDFEKIHRELKIIDQNATITEKLLEAFPGYYGRFICLHFARFLNEAIATEAQQEAYEEIREFLDNIPLLKLPEELQSFLEENTKSFTTENIRGMLESTRKSIENPEAFLAENKEILQQYLKYRQSEEYLNSPAHRLQDLLKSFNSTSGYYDIFIPAMRRLSPSYGEYCRQIEKANEKLIADLPEIAKL